MHAKIVARMALALIAWVLCDQEQALSAKDLTLQVRTVSDMGVLIISDDRQVCLNGVWLGGLSPSTEQRAAVKQTLLALVDDQPVRIFSDEPPSFDRYGCEVADVRSADGLLLQHDLLERGQAIVRPSSSFERSEDIDAWLALEQQARQAGLGIWRDRSSHPRKAAAMAHHIGKASLVEGRVLRTYSNDRYTYLNFGPDWRTDFTVRLRQKLLKKSGFDPSLLNGKNVRVRGFVQESRGPLIDISHLKQIEVIP